MFASFGAVGLMGPMAKQVNVSRLDERKRGVGGELVKKGAVVEGIQRWRTRCSMGLTVPS